MSEKAVFHIALEGAYEDGFLYMGQLLAVRDDRALVQADLANLIPQAYDDPAKLLVAEMFLLRNDFITQPGAARLLSIPSVHSEIEAIASSARMEVDEEEWIETDDFSRILPEGDVLDLCVYNKRLFIGTTMGMVHSDLIEDAQDVRLARATKRTDARCLAVTARSGTVVASCGDEGLFINYDEFDELDRPLSSKGLHFDNRSLRAGWLGFNLVNYSSPIDAESFRSKFDRRERASAVITSMARDDKLLEGETSDWTDLTFSFNSHNTFFTRAAGGAFRVRTRTWYSGRLGKVENSYEGSIEQPVSVHSCDAGLIVETFDRVLLLTENGASTLFEGQAIAVRTFPNSKHYRNIALIVADDSLHLISPVPELVG